MEDTYIKMKYENCLDRPYDGQDAEYNFVRFAISRYGRHMETIRFAQPVTEAEAIAAAEAYLSTPMDMQHYDRIYDDLLIGQEVDELETRGDALASCIFLEQINKDKNGIELVCGS